MCILDQASNNCHGQKIGMSAAKGSLLCCSRDLRVQLIRTLRRSVINLQLTSKHGELVLGFVGAKAIQARQTRNGWLFGWTVWTL